MDHCRSQRHHQPHPHHRNAHDDFRPQYDPACDPLKINNLDNNVVEPIQVALAGMQESIKHVVILTLESTRKDVFPFRKESHVYEKILSTYEDDDAIDALNEKLSRLTPVAEILSGEPIGFHKTADSQTRIPSKHTWSNRFNKSSGGINVQGVQTTSDYTLKSMLGSYCGVEGLPVDFTEEVHSQIYQPCIPHILDRLNEDLQEKPLELSRSSQNHTRSTFLSSPWTSVVVQAITDQFDSQSRLHEHMGFRLAFSKETIRNQSAKYYPPREPESNYFGFPETETLPYLKDVFETAERENRRLFLAHLTSTTHHPFSTPESWGAHKQYLGRSRWRSEDPFNSYLNTIKYQDEWIGTVFDVLEEIGVIDKTLVVIVGDQ
jgi:hypothetical protein